MKDEKLLIEMGKRIAQRRKKLSLSQEELAAVADVTPQMISTAERGEKALRPENLLKLSGALGVSSDFLLTGEWMAKDSGLLSGKLASVPPKYFYFIETVIESCLLFEEEEQKREEAKEPK